jgi:TatD DNase family protein
MEPPIGGAPPPPAFIDSHAHLGMPAFEGDLPGVLERAASAGLTDVLTASTSLEDADRNAGLAKPGGTPRVWAAIGVHPHEASKWREGDEERLERLLRRPGVVAIGETGLDYHYDLSPREIQREVLARQVRLAARLALPIIVHCREASEDVGVILEQEGGRISGGVLHCFTEDEPFARRCLDLGFYISFSGILTFKSSSALREIARMIPEDRLLIETDSPYLAPVPHRGERNEPRRAILVLETLAKIRDVPPSAIAGAIVRNFQAFISRGKT